MIRRQAEVKTFDVESSLMEGEDVKVKIAHAEVKIEVKMKMGNWRLRNI